MKSHTKSRRGCVQCKHRKVKCDETLPCCDRCRRRHEHCSYLDEVYGSPGRQSSTRELDNNNNNSGNNNNNNAPISATTPGSSSGGSIALGPGPGPGLGPGSGSGPSLPGAHTFTSGPDSASSPGYGHPHSSFNSGPRGPPSQIPGRLSMLDSSASYHNQNHNHNHNHNHNPYDAPNPSRPLSVTQSPAGTPLPLSIPPPLSDSTNGYVVDMELLHFYLTCTYKTLWGRPEGKLVWRDVIFREALNHPALMNGLLTTAALHRIVTLGQTHGPAAAAVYHSIALHKQRQALEGLVVLLRSLDPDSCRAIFPLSMMVSFWAFVSRDVPEELGILTTLDVNGGIQPPPVTNNSSSNNNNNNNSNNGSMSNHASPSAMKTEPSTPLPLPHPHSLTQNHHSLHHHQQPPQQQQLAPVRSALDLFVELIRRIRAVQTIAQESISWLTQSDFLPLMAIPNYDTLPALPPGITAALHSLDAHIQRTPRIAAMLSGLDSRYSLGCMYQLSRCPDWLELVTGWPMTLPQNFVDELGRRNPAALTVFAYWLGCFQVLEERWWARGWTAALIVEIEDAVRGGEWAALVDWVRMYLSIIK